MKPLFDQVVIIGVGLIGGSLGLALCSRGLAGTVTGMDPDRQNLELAVEAEAVHQGFDHMSEKFFAAVSRADLVVIATPVGLTVDSIRRIAPYLKEGCIVTDVGSTKAAIVREAEDILPSGTCFIGGHPMTGSEVSGVKGADRYLFENAVYVLTPTDKSCPEAMQQLRDLVRALGANIIETDPDEHDLMVAAISHLPHLVAATLVSTVGEIHRDHQGVLLLAAGGFRDTTRVASGHPVMWKDICLSNRESILQVLDRFRDVLDRTRETVEKCDEQRLLDWFEQARELRRNIPSKIRGYLPVVHEIVVTVPDRPGVIGQLAGYLGEAGVNINDLEILRVREGEGGTIRLAFSSEADQERALTVLGKNNVSAKRR